MRSGPRGTVTKDEALVFYTYDGREPDAPRFTFHAAFARYTPEQQQWLLAQPPHVQQQYLQ